MKHNAPFKLDFVIQEKPLHLGFGQSQVLIFSLYNQMLNSFERVTVDC